MLTKPFKPLALAFLVNLIISVEDKIKLKKKKKKITWVIRNRAEVSALVLSCAYFLKNTKNQ